MFKILELEPSTIPLDYWGGFFDQGLGLTTNSRITTLPKPLIRVGYSVRGDLINLLDRAYPGDIYPSSGTADFPRRRPALLWVRQDMESIVDFIKTVNPYLTVKREQASHLRDYTEWLIPRADLPPTRRDYQRSHQYLDTLAEAKKRSFFFPRINPTLPRLAGILDLGGTIGIKHTEGDYSLFLAYTSPFEALVRGLDKMFDLDMTKVKALRSDGLKSYHWGVENNEFTRLVLEALMPYLTYMKPFAQLGLEFLDEKQRIGKEYFFNRLEATKAAQEAGFTSAHEFGEARRKYYLTEMRKLRYPSPEQAPRIAA